jgi:circadian clock protein KaiB
MNASNESNWQFRLFISGDSPKNDNAVAVLEHICQKYLEGKCDIEVIDITLDQLTAMKENILATPTLIKKTPTPVQRFIGDLSGEEQLLLRLNISTKE